MDAKDKEQLHASPIPAEAVELQQDINDVVGQQIDNADPLENRTFFRTERLMKRTHYVCASSKCRAEDWYNTYEEETIPEAINCWSCHAGLKVDPNSMVQRRLGMFAVPGSDVTFRPQPSDQPGSTRVPQPGGSPARTIPGVGRRN